jgi:hypothetical protein
MERGGQGQLGHEGRRAHRRQARRQGYRLSRQQEFLQGLPDQGRVLTDEDANSGIFIRCDQFAKIDAKICYEVNIFDKRPDPSYGTGAIVDVARVDPMPKAAGKWNIYEITAKGPHLTIVLNGQKTADVDDSKPSADRLRCNTVRAW